MPLPTSEDIIPPLTHELPLTFLLMILYLAVSVTSILAPMGMPVCVLSRPQVTIAWVLGLGVELTPVTSRDYIITSEGGGGCLQGLGISQSNGFLILSFFDFPLIDFGQLDNLFSFE